MKGDRPLLVLITSPLLGPSSWSPLAAALSARGWGMVISLDEADLPGRPFWQSTVAGAVRSLREVPQNQAVVLIGHSGAGALLPATAAAIPQRVVAFVLVDAGLPAPGRSRLETMQDEGPGGAAFATELSAVLDAGGRYPEWTDAELAPLIPDPVRRQQLLAEMRPRGREFWTEPLPDAVLPTDVPCAYLQFSESYVTAAEQARSMGWPVLYLRAGHFHHLVDETSVADAIGSLLADLTSNEVRTTEP